MRRHELSDAEWSRIEPLLGSRSGPRSKRGDRDFINAVVWRVKTGVQWRDLPERFGHWKTVYNRFHRWTKTGRWEAFFKALRLDVDELGSLADVKLPRFRGVPPAVRKGSHDAEVTSPIPAGVP
ncbi:transposase [Myxococcus xanthus]|nr:transposase [Myxococcus xanthus]